MTCVSKYGILKVEAHTQQEEEVARVTVGTR